ncbi:DUF1850 domain-containing protein [Bacillus sp. SCS-153A]|uniref:DUF1850 domain-containing protein n=1 Tax=Rossellomorea sedimentorum TaxID=3115294 RepID=UPI0039057BF4
MKKTFLYSLFAFFLLLLLPVHVLVLADLEKTVKIEPYYKSVTFSLRWTHSVEKEDWEEFFQVEDENILLQSTRFKTFGAGVPDNAGEETFIKDGWVYMTNIHQPIGDSLQFQTGKETNHRLFIKEEHLSLSPQQSYDLYTTKMPIYEYLFSLIIATRGENL